MLSGDDEEIGISLPRRTGHDGAGHPRARRRRPAVSWWIEAFTELHRLLRTAGFTRTGPGRRGVPDRVLHRGCRRAGRVRAVDRVPALAGRVEVVSRPAVGTPSPYDGPMVDLDGAYSAVGERSSSKALASDGPVVERYLPLGG